MMTPENEQALTKALERRNAAHASWVAAKNEEANAYRAFRQAEDEFARSAYAVAGPVAVIGGFQCRTEMHHTYTSVITPVEQNETPEKRSE